MDFAQKLVSRPGRGVVALFATLGGVVLLVGRVLSRLLRRKVDRGEFWRAAFGFGEKSILIMMLASAFTGMILVLQGAVYVEKYGLRSFVGW